MAPSAASPAQPLDYATARYADGPRLSGELLPRVPATAEWNNVRRELRAMRDEYRLVRLETVDRLSIRLGIHPALLPDGVWTTWRPRRERVAA
jgi:hypothetical protein